MRRHLLLVATAALAVLIVGFPVGAASSTFRWTATLGSNGHHGTIAIAAPGTGGGTATVTLRGLSASAVYSMEVYAGTCTHRGVWLFPLKAQRTDVSGRLHVHLPLSTTTMNKVRSATWGSGRMTVRVSRGSALAACSTFAEPRTAWPTPTPTPTPPPTPTPTPTWTGDPIAPGTIDWDLARCPTAADVASVNADVPMTWLADPTAGTLVCTAAAGSANLTRFQERVYQAILSMKRIHFDAPLPWTSLSLYDWFVGSIDGITFINNGGNSFCCSPAHVINIQARANSIALTTNRWWKPSLADRVGLPGLVDLLLHEARHSEGGHPHMCGTGDDNMIGEMGAWAIVYYYYMWLAQHGDPVYLAPPADAPSVDGKPSSEFYRQRELWYAQVLKDTRFCLEPH
jgi:hypothetical protein